MHLHCATCISNSWSCVCRVYLDGWSTIGSCGSRLELTGLTLRLYGATVVKTLTDNVSHVIVDSRYTA